jgi:hypothetical protein
MFDDWCEINSNTQGKRKTLFRLTEKKDGRAAIQAHLIECVRSHYEKLEQIAEDVKLLGYPSASAILGEQLPRTKRARSGEIGEILATEFMITKTEFRIPVRRLRYKDGREMALRGDDFLGIYEDKQGRLYFLKGESKSRRTITSTVIADARKRLASDDGRPTAISILFTASRLLEAEGDDAALGRKVRNEVALRAVSPGRITHALFTLSGNAPESGLTKDLNAADGAHTHVSAGLQIEDHQTFIATIYDEVGNLGDD